MKFNLFFDSNLAKLQPGGDNYKSHDFTFRFTPSIKPWEGCQPQGGRSTICTWAIRGTTSVVSTTTTPSGTARRQVAAGRGKPLPFPMRCTTILASITTFQRRPAKTQTAMTSWHYTSTSAFTVLSSISHPYYEVDLTQGNFAGLVGFDSKVFSGAGGCGWQGSWYNTRGWLGLHPLRHPQKGGERCGEQRTFLVLHRWPGGQLPLSERTKTTQVATR